MYTVVAGATDPLFDGSVHNVTTVIMQHGYWDSSPGNHKSIHMDIGPYLAMLEIEPEFEGAGMELVEEKVKKGHIMIYGWVMVKVMHVSRFLLLFKRPFLRTMTNLVG